MLQHHVHLVGSIPLADAGEVFETASSIVGPALLRIPDGETGARKAWLNWMEPIFSENAGFEATGEIYQHHPTAASNPRYRLKAGLSPDDVELKLWHAKVAIDSYKVFEKLKQQGAVPAHCRFQFAFAHPISVVRRFLVEELFDVFEAKYEQALLAEVDKVIAAIPHDQLAIQWDCASAFFELLEKGKPTRFGQTKDEMQEAFTEHNARLSQKIPVGVDLLYHLCYGDSGHRHSVEPTDMADMVEFANRLVSKVERPIQLFHMPVPRSRDDDAYYAPLKELRLPRETEISLGLIHYTDGLEGTRRRMAAAERHLSDFFISTECGFGRRPSETVRPLLQLHAKLAGVA